MWQWLTNSHLLGVDNRLSMYVFLILFKIHSDFGPIKYVIVSTLKAKGSVSRLETLSGQFPASSQRKIAPLLPQIFVKETPLKIFILSTISLMAPQGKVKGKEKTLSSRTHTMYLLKILTSPSQKERFMENFHNKKLITPKYTDLKSFPSECFSFQHIFAPIGI